MIAFLALLALFFGLPLLSNRVSAPRNLSGPDLFAFAKAVFRWWRDLGVQVLKTFVRFHNQGDLT